MRPIPLLETLSLGKTNELWANNIPCTAVKKPPSLSSAQVIRDLQHAFRSSKLFAPLLEETLARDAQNKHRSKRRRIDNDNVFKMGHGGTLDPMATGVLIIGIGRGTKSLHNFLDGTKSYETVVLFGRSTDTYDICGKVIAAAETGHITKELVEKKLESFRGDIKQVPPIYSALKVNGIKAYDYARSGKELPRELAAREMQVTQCVITDWFDSGKHEYRWPATQAAQQEKEAFQRLSRRNNTVNLSDGPVTTEESSPVATEESRNLHSQIELDLPIEEPPPKDSTSLSRAEKAGLHTHEISNLSEEIANAPAVRIRLTVSSGFYVRSFANDLGLACRSYGTMAELARTRQAEYSTNESEQHLIPAINHADFERGEDVWGPQISKVLEDWLARHPAHQQRAQSPASSTPKNSGRSYGRHVQGAKRGKRRNSSSPE